MATIRTFLAGLLLLATTAAFGQSKDQQATDILKLINEHRASLHLRPLKMDTLISSVAAKHSKNMASGKVPFSHDGFEERTAKINKQYPLANGWAENVAEGTTTASATVDMWLHSPNHKKNIEGDYDLTGIGIAMDPKGTPYYTQIFIRSGRPSNQ
jgi:uncharacterized protein YkwD